MGRTSKTGIPSIVDRARAFIEANGGNRLIAAIALLVGVQAVFGLNALSAWTENRQIALLTLKAEVAGMQALTDDADLSETVASARQVLAQETARVHTAPTAGFVSADIQSYLRAVGARTAMAELQITVNLEDTDSEDLVRFVVDLTGVEASPGAFAAFLAELRAGPAAYGVSSFVWDARQLRVRAKLETLALISETPGEP